MYMLLGESGKYALVLDLYGLEMKYVRENILTPGWEHVYINIHRGD